MSSLLHHLDPTVLRSPHGRGIRHDGPRVSQTLCADPVSVHPEVPHERSLHRRGTRIELSPLTGTDHSERPLSRRSA